LSGPEAAREPLADDVDARRAIFVVAILEFPSLDEVDTGAAKVSRRHAFDRQPRRARVATRVPSLDGDPLIGVAGDEKVGDASHRHDARQPPDAFSGLTKEPDDRWLIRVSLSWQIEGHDDEVVRRVPWILALRAEKTLREEHRADDEEEGAGDLRGDEKVLQSMAWEARLIACAERGAGIRPRGGERRNGAARENNDKAGEKRDRHGRRVEPDFVDARQRARPVRQQQLDQDDEIALQVALSRVGANYPSGSRIAASSLG
jgi:hypothetical protein